jgi:hypothetical protein
MGQYYYIVNIDKKQFLYPHKFGDGLKLLEFGCSACGTLTGLTILLADGNNRGGGDLRSENPIIGTWAGDRIVIAGDYADADNFGVKTSTPKAQGRNLFDEAGESYQDISDKVITALKDDKYIKSKLRKSL